MSTTSPQAPKTPNRLTAFETLLLVAAVVAARLVAARVCHIYDDAFITYRYALNFAQGLGLVFNPGAIWEPVLGTTTPGYAAWLALNAKLGLDVVQASLFWNFVSDGVSALLLIRLLDADRLRSTLAVLAFASFPEIARISAGGMEAPILCMLVLVTLVFVRRERFGWAGFSAALCCTIRPEAVLFVGVLALPLLGRWSSFVRFLSPVAVIGVVYTALLVWTYGSPIPQSVVSKASVHGDSPLLDTWREIAQQAFLPRRLYLPALPFVLFGLVRSLRMRFALRGLILFALAISAAYFAARPHTWGWYYYVPLTAWTVWLALGLEPLARQIAARVPSLGDLARRFGTVAATVAAGAFVWFGTARMTDHVSARVYEPMSTWMREAARNEDGLTLLASDIGAVSYFAALYCNDSTRGRIYDSQGLTWPQALEFPSQMDAILASEPEYLLLTAEQAEIGPMREREAVLRAYYPIRRFSVSGATELEPTLDELPAYWMQDYLLYRRRL